MKKIHFALLLVICIIFSALVWQFRTYLKFFPWENSYEFQSISEIVGGNGTDTYAIDNGRKTLLIINENNQVSAKVDGGSTSAAFFEVTHVTDDGNGTVFLADVYYGDKGNIIQSERILRLNGNKSEILYEWDYEEAENPPLQNGRIVQLEYRDGNIYCLRQEEDGLIWDCVTVSDSPVLTEIFAWELQGDAESSFYDSDNDICAVATRTGHIYVYYHDSQSWEPVEDLNDNQIPAQLLIKDDKLYYTDLENIYVGKVYLGSTANELGSPEVVCDDGNLYQKISAMPDGKGVYLTDYVGYYYCEDIDNGGEMVSVEEAPLSFSNKCVLVWLMLAVVAIIVLIFLIKLIIKLFRYIRSSESQTGFFIVVLVVAALLIGTVISGSLLSQMSTTIRQNLISGLSLYANTTALQIDGDSVLNMRNPEAWGTEEYQALKEELDANIDVAYSQENYYYYVIYVPSEDGVFIDAIMDYESTFAPSTPAYLYEDNEYVQVLETGESFIQEGEDSAYGSWVYVDAPIRNAAGEVTAVLEIGSNNDRVTEQIRSVIVESAYSVFCSALIITMIILEGMFAYDFYQRKRQLSRQGEYKGIDVPVRTIVFLIYMSMGMQDAFVVLLSSRLYENLGGSWMASVIPSGVAAALPLSLELLISAVASALGGGIAEKFGTKRMFLVGFSSQIIGYILCAAELGYFGLLIGLALVGFGVGLVYVAANTMVALAESQEAKEKGYADVSAGVMSGASIGVGLGSMILTFGNYSMVYAVAAFLMLVGILICRKAENVVKEDKEEKVKVNVFAFMKNRKVFAFLLLLLTPFLMMTAFKDYFFPMYAETIGVSEVRIGQIYLVLGMCVLYTGPKLAEFMIKIFKGKGSIIAATLVLISGMVVFAVSPGMVTSIIALALLYVANSFGYTCQYFYFGNMKIVSRFGEGNAMGVYSVFESLGQTLGPMLFGAVLMLGYQQGIVVIVEILVVTLVLFILLSLKKDKKEKE